MKVQRLFKIQVLDNDNAEIQKTLWKGNLAGVRVSGEVYRIVAAVRPFLWFRSISNRSPKEGEL